MNAPTGVEGNATTELSELDAQRALEELLDPDADLGYSAEVGGADQEVDMVDNEEPVNPEDTDNDETDEEEEAEEQEETEDQEEGDETDDLPESLQALAEDTEVPLDKLMDMKVSVELDGENSEVSIADAIAGYQRQTDYDSGMDALRKSFDALDQVYGQYDSRGRAQEEGVKAHHDALEEVVDQFFKSENMEAKRTSNPAEYLLYRESIQEVKDKLAKDRADAEEKFNTTRAQNEDDNMRIQAAFLKEREGMTDADIDRAVKTLSETYGFTKQGAIAAGFGRLAKISHELYKANEELKELRQFKESAGKASTKAKGKAPKTAKSGGKAPTQGKSLGDRLAQRLATQGDPAAAAALLDQIEQGVE